ncbi:bacillithiol biosynthesis deacetylase BshB1, partial [candidate division KSB1 bacterium]|nr:bacillithiol biosynthesis deacetylase BshB1 [candidate division KSB1 bacterium]
ALAFGAHPDDVELCCGGTMVKLGALGYKTGTITLTRAELGTNGNPELRAQEFSAAGEIMGLSLTKSLDIPDGDVRLSRENKLKVIREIRKYQPRIIFAPYWVARHPDHEHGSYLVRDAAYLAGLKKIDTGQEPHRPNKVIYYASRYEFKPTFIVDISQYHERKIEAIRAYKSQFFIKKEDENTGEVTYISRPEFFESIINRAKQYGIYIGAQYGEPFLIRETLKIDDPVAYFGPEFLQSIP